MQVLNALHDPSFAHTSASFSSIYDFLPNSAKIRYAWMASLCHNTKPRSLSWYSSSSFLQHPFNTALPHTSYLPVHALRLSAFCTESLPPLAVGTARFKYYPRHETTIRFYCSQASQGHSHFNCLPSLLSATLFYHPLPKTLDLAGPATYSTSWHSHPSYHLRPHSRQNHICCFWY